MAQPNPERYPLNSCKKYKTRVVVPLSLGTNIGSAAAISPMGTSIIKAAAGPFNAKQTESAAICRPFAYGQAVGYLPSKLRQAWALQTFKLQETSAAAVWIAATPGGASVVLKLGNFRAIFKGRNRIAHAALTVTAVGLISALSCLPYAHAAESTAKTPLLKTPVQLGAAATSSLQQPHAPEAKVQPAVDELTFNMKFESFLNRERPPAGVPDYTQFGAHFRTESDGRYLKGVLELGGSFATAIENYSNVYVPEAYFDVQTENFTEAELNGDSRARLSVGRRLETWSVLDRTWDLGLWEPLNRFDALRPIDQGLTGAFLEAGTGNVKVVIFASPVFIPEQGGGFTLQNGKFRTTNPWFVEPTDRLILFSETTQVQYDLRTPSTGSVITHASGGALLRYGNFQDGFHAQTSYAIKPRNQLSTPFEGSLNLTDTTSYAFVQIEPQVIYHQLAAFELGYSGMSADGERGFSVGVSGLADIPMNESPGDGLTYQTLDPLTLFSPHVSAAFDLGRSMDVDLAVSYLTSSGGGFTMRGPFASDKAVFGSRVPFREAVALDGRVAIGKGRRTTVTFGGRWLEELAEQGSLLSADASVDFSMNGHTQDWRVSLMGDVLGSRLPANENVGYVSRYRGNDRWMTQIRFIF